MLLILLAGCSTAHKPAQTRSIDCPVSVPVPAPVIGKPTAAKISTLEIRVELAREAERSRGDCWRAAVEGTQK